MKGRSGRSVTAPRSRRWQVQRCLLRPSMPFARPLPPPSILRLTCGAADERNSSSKGSERSARLGMALLWRRFSVSSSPGFHAWFLWRGIYLMKMPGLNRKVRIATDWLLHALFPPELAQTKVAFESGIRKQHFEPGDIIFQQGDLGDSVYVI